MRSLATASSEEVERHVQHRRAPARRIGRRSARRAWLKKEGDRVEVGEPVVELETEKIDLEVSAESAGVHRQHQAPGRRGRQGRRGAGRRRRERRQAPAAPPQPRQPRSRRQPAAPTDVAAAADDAKPRRPHAHGQGSRREPRAVQGSGTAGRVMKQDVQGALRRPGRSRAGTGRRPAAPPARRRRREAGRATSGPSRRPVPASRSEKRVRMTKRRADDRPAAGRGAAHGRDADDVQRDRHDRAHGAARAAQGGVQEAARRRPRHRVVLRQGEHRRAAGVPAAQRRDPGRRDRLQAATTTSAWRSAPKAAWSCRCCATPTRCRSPRSSRRSATSPSARRRRHADARGLTGGTFTITNGGVFGSLLSTPILNPPQVGHPRPAQDPGARRSP